MDIKQIWKSAKKKVMDKVSSISFDLWIKPLEAEEFSNGEFVLSAQTSMGKQQAMNDRHFPHIEYEIKEAAPIVEKVIIIDGVEKEERYTTEKEVKKPQTTVGKFSIINPLQTFESFIVGKSNEVVAAAAESVANNPAKRINPLFIYGGSGLGKTHLLNAIANHIGENNPKLKIALATCEKFTNDYVEALKNKTVASFRTAYRNIDVLLIDDIQFIENKVSTQEEFFHTFNDLYQNNRQIVLTSDRHADKLATLEERMRSRFKSGLIQDVSSPDIEMRIAILQKKATLENYRLEPEAIEFLAKKGVEQNMNVRDMEAALFRVIFFAKLKGRTIPNLEDCIGAMNEPNEDKISKTTAKDVILKVCKYFNISKDDIVGKKRNREFVEPRMVAIYLICEVLNIPLVNIGQLLGGRDHTTVLHSRNKIATQLQKDVRMKRIVEDLKSMLNE
ncbi:MAG: chromosomal replication initiator protein DnaA [Firmicutes bacterium]|nr:chromosomal replication initiator protein DnaA [Bacillota bacterium]